MFCTLPATVVTMSFCIFIASSTATTSPSLTESPALTGTLTINPCMGASTVPSEFLDGGGVVALTAGAAPDEGVTVIPAPLTRTLKTSPSTSTSNSATETGGAGGGTAGGSGSAEEVTATGAGSGFERSVFGAGPRRKSGAMLGNMRWISTLSSVGS